MSMTAEEQWLTHPVLVRWRKCMDDIDEPCAMSLIANDTLVSCIQEAIAAVAEERNDIYEHVMSEAERIKNLLPDDKPDVVSGIVAIATAIRQRDKA